MSDAQVHQDAGRRAIHIALVAVVAAALIGFFVGVDYGVPKPELNATQLTPHDEASDRRVIAATAYAELASTDIGPNRDWSSDLRKLQWSAPDLLDVLPTPDEASRASALKQRAARRAYNGAPPVVPHAVNQLSPSNCLSCHGEGLKLANRSANQLPHPYLTNCTQCHVPQESEQFAAFVLAENTFDGAASPINGSRAWVGAPPQIPHTTHMRDNCLACHGPLGLDGLHTTHPWRQNCLQCHAPSAQFDQRFFDTQPTFLESLQIRSKTSELVPGETS